MCTMYLMMEKSIHHLVLRTRYWVLDTPHQVPSLKLSQSSPWRKVRVAQGIEGQFKLHEVVTSTPC
jgi:hypothetical protein